MCGITGYITNKNNSRFAQEKLRRLLVSGETRGTDASGVGFVKSKIAFYYYKAPIPASKLVSKKNFNEMLKEHNPNILIGHNRLKTQGDTDNNLNNHPILTKTGLILIHNGIIRNDKDILEKYKLKADGEVDSEAIVRLLEYYIVALKKPVIKAIQLTAKKLDGSLAIALLNAKEPRTIYLASSGNPITLAYHKPTGTIFFASTEDILKQGLFTYNEYRNGMFYEEAGEADFVFQDMQDDTGIKITPKGYEDFEIDRPTIATTTNYYQNKYAGEDRESKYSSYSIPSQKPLEVERLDEEVIYKAVLEADSTFEVFDAIKRPSVYFSEHLLQRLEHIQDTLATGEYETQFDEFEELALGSEVKRIITTLTDRQEITSREIFVPEAGEILDCKDVLTEASGCKNFEYAFSDLNAHLYEKWQLEELKEEAEVSEILDEKDPDQKELTFKN